MQEVSATFQYLEKSPKWDSEKPYYISGPLPQEQLHLRSNLSFSFHSVDVKDLRSAGQLTGIKEHVTVESHGFELATWKSPVPLTLDNEAQDSTEPYMAEVAKWLKTRFEAEVVISYAYRVRVRFG
jgi:predicted component of type VI protein secretion system